MSPRLIRPALLLPLALLAIAPTLGGCAVDGRYPSLSPRPIEDISLAEPTPPPVPKGTPESQAAARYAPVVEKARAADVDFNHALEAARPALTAGRGAAQGSDGWLAAQAALTRVEAARDPVTAALADLDAARNGDAPRADSGIAAAVAQAYSAVQAIDAEEARALTALWPAD
jgi:hypothetical protein